MTRNTHKLEIGGKVFDFGQRTYVMGIVNVTPDSFSDGGQFLDPQKAIDHGLRLAEDGADILDIGGESTRPGSQSVSAEEERERVVPVIRGLRDAGCDLPISIDTTKSEVARAALDAGANILNDISAMSFDPRMVEVAVTNRAPSILMHTTAKPEVMQQFTDYSDLLGEIGGFLAKQAEVLIQAGLPRELIWLDPGIGFGKTLEQNLQLMNRVEAFHDLGYVLLYGPSRKSFMQPILHKAAPERLYGTLGAVAMCIARGVQVLRVHDVAETVDLCRVADSIIHETAVQRETP